jgi:hypothetical protein
LSTAQHYRDQAVQLRQQASTVQTEDLRSLLLKDAAAYERLAKWADEHRWGQQRG